MPTTRSNSQDFPGLTSVPSNPPPGSPSSISSISSKKLPKFFQNRSKGPPKGKEIPVPINSSVAKRNSFVDQNGYIFDTSPSTSPSSEESHVLPQRSSPFSRNRSSSKSSVSSPLPIPHRPSSPSPLHHDHDASVPSKLSNWISSSSTGGLSLPHILTSHGSLTKHLSIPSPHKKGRLSIGDTISSGKASHPASPISDSSSASLKMKDLGTKKGKSRQFLDKALQYILDTDSNHDGSREDIWLMGRLYSYPVEGLPPMESPLQESPPRGSEDEVQSYSLPTRRHSSLVSVSPTRRRTEGLLSAPPAHLRASTGESVDSAGSSSSNSSSRHHHPPPSDSHSSISSASSPTRTSRFLHHPHRQSTLPAVSPSRSSTFIIEQQPPSPASRVDSFSDSTTRSGYPTAFNEDFFSRLWLTYRGGWEVPLRSDAQLSDLPPPSSPHNNSDSIDGSLVSSPSSLVTGSHPNTSQTSSFLNPNSSSNSQVSASTHESGNTQLSTSTASAKQQHHAKWGNNLLASFGIGSKEFTSDAGWGCMLRTGQCVLAEALSRVLLGRDFRRDHISTSPSIQQAYMRLLTWFMDTPSSSAPFSVHRMALAGKAFGKDVGTWFGPSTAAGAVKTLVGAFPECGIGVCVAEDGMLYETDVVEASRSPTQQRPSSLSKNRNHHRHHHHHDSGSSGSAATFPDWGDRPVLVLAGIRLGLDGVNPVYYDCLKQLYTIPQGVGIAGGRPSSSYWFIGVQGNSLIYLDPHHARPAMCGTLLSSSSASSTGSHVSSCSPPTSSPSPVSTGENVQDGGTEGVGVGMSWEEETRTYHCDRVRKIKLNSMDPSMLLGFLVKDRKEWEDLRRRISELPKSIGFYIQDEPPAWRKEHELMEEDEEEDDSLLESISDSTSNLSERGDGDGDVSFEDGPERRSDERDTDRTRVGDQSGGEGDDRDDESLETAAGPRHRDEDLEDDEYEDDDEDEDEFLDVDPRIAKRSSILAFPSKGVDEEKRSNIVGGVAAI